MTNCKVLMTYRGPRAPRREQDRRRPRTLVLLLTPLAMACEVGEDRSSGAPGFTVRDSAGVRIVDTGRPALDTRLAWEVGAQPSLSIGAVDSGEADQLFRVTDATRLSDGRIAIANSGSNEIRVFHPDGTHADTWGGPGDGPGEFSGYSPTAVAPWRGDSIAAANPWGLRLSLFDSAGNHGRDIALSPPLMDVVDVLPGGSIFAKSSSGLREDATGSSGLVRMDEEWGVLAADGSRRASLGEHPGAEWWAILNPDGSILGGRPHPYGRTTVGAVWGDRAAIGDTERYEIRVFSDDGALVAIVRREAELDAPSRADLDASLERLYADFPDEARADALAEARDMPLVESYPAFAGIMADRTGYLWVREYRAPDAEGPVWAVFDPDGHPQGLVETPPGLRLLEIGEDYLLGWRSDDVQVEYVQIWPLSRGAILADLARRARLARIEPDTPGPSDGDQRRTATTPIRWTSSESATWTRGRPSGRKVSGIGNPSGSTPTMRPSAASSRMRLPSVVLISTQSCSSGATASASTICGRGWKPCLSRVSPRSSSQGPRYP